MNTLNIVNITNPLYQDFWYGGFVMPTIRANRTLQTTKAYGIIGLNRPFGNQMHLTVRTDGGDILRILGISSQSLEKSSSLVASYVSLEKMPVTPGELPTPTREVERNMELCSECNRYHPKHVPCDNVDAFFDAVAEYEAFIMVGVLDGGGDE